MKTSQKEILDVFADFYGDLYRSRQEVNFPFPVGTIRSSLPQVSAQEVDDELKKMKRGKAGDRAGVVAEMLKKGGENFKELLAEMFTLVLKGTWETPTSWMKSFVIVLHKKGDTKVPANYRPITLLPIIYKLFSRVICRRLRSKLEQAQSTDQAGFRSGFSCDDHLLTAVLLIEQCSEFHLPLWMCAVDFQKAFDCVEHASLWQSMLEQGIEP